MVDPHKETHQFPQQAHQKVASPSTAAKVSMASSTRILIRAIWPWMMATPVAV